jgi:hypothetical protein
MITSKYSLVLSVFKKLVISFCVILFSGQLVGQTILFEKLVFDNFQESKIQNIFPSKDLKERNFRSILVYEYQNTCDKFDTVYSAKIDTVGRIIYEESIWGKDTTIYKYSYNPLIIEMRLDISNYDGGTTIYYFDRQNRMVKRKEIKNEIGSSISVFKYEEQMESEFHIYGMDSLLVNKTLFDSLGNEIKDIRYYPAIEDSIIIFKTYDNYNNLIEESRVVSKEFINSKAFHYQNHYPYNHKYSYKYDSLGRIKSMDANLGYNTYISDYCNFDFGREVKTRFDSGNKSTIVELEYKRENVLLESGNDYIKITSYLDVSCQLPEKIIFKSFIGKNNSPIIYQIDYK